jgi:hypothetical protein
MVDSLEDEHTRRAVHTTKTVQEIEMLNQGGESNNEKAK